jgi:hemerythrin-like domain-containing protein
VRSPADKTDFVGYCLAWVECVATHHHYEETELFPNIDKAAEQTGWMEGAVHEHEAFQGGFEKFKQYLQDKGAEGVEAQELIKIMDEFKTPLHDHLKAEQPAIVRWPSTAPRRGRLIS